MNGPLLSWYRQTETTNHYEARAIATDHSGNIFISGGTNASAEHGDIDSFLVKYDGQGRQLWHKKTETAAGDYAYAMATDHLGNVLISGYTTAKEDHGGQDSFLAKYDGEGRQLWYKKTETDERDEARAIATDHLGNVFISGLTNTKARHGGIDGFLAKYDGKGQQLWRKKTETAAGDYAYAIATDHLGNVLISGRILVEKKHGGEDAFLAKYDGEGEQLWFKKTETAVRDYAYAIATDHLGNVLISGIAYVDADQGGEDAFLAKYGSQGNLIWHEKIETSARDKANAIATDRFGNVFISGITSAKAEHGGRDGFLAKYDGQGQKVWLKKTETIAWDEAYGIATDHLGNVFIGGITAAGAEYGASNAFLAKYVDDFSVTQHHLLLENKVDALSKELNELRHAQLPFELDLALIQMANDRTNRGKGRLSEAEAQEIIDQAQVEGSINETRKKTLAYIYARYSLTKGAVEKIMQALH